MIFPLFKRWFYAATGVVSSHRQSTKEASYPQNSQTKRRQSKHTGSSSGLQSGNKKSRNFQHPLSIPNDTAWGSDEAIVTMKNSPNVVVQDKTSETTLAAAYELDDLDFVVRERNTNGGAENSQEQGLGAIMMTREWNIKESHEQVRPHSRDGRMGYTEPDGWRG